MLCKQQHAGCVDGKAARQDVRVDVVQASLRAHTSIGVVQQACAVNDEVDGVDARSDLSHRSLEGRFPCHIDFEANDLGGAISVHSCSRARCGEYACDSRIGGDLPDEPGPYTTACADDDASERRGCAGHES